MKRRHHIAWCLGAGCVVATGARSQPQRQYRIGILYGVTRGPGGALFESELAQRGFVEGRNLIIDRREAHRDASRLPALAAELVAQQPDVIFTQAGTLGARAAKAATSRIPIVFESSGDPVAAGLVTSLAKPGGNLTGTAIFTRELLSKRMQILAETLSKPARLAVLDVVRTAEQRAVWVDPFPTLAGVSFELFEMPGAAELETIFQRIVRWGATGLVVVHTPLTAGFAKEIVHLATEHRLPGIAEAPWFAEFGLMLAYSTDYNEAFRRGAEYVSRILAGAKPADLPVMQASRFEFVVNRKTANALGVRIPNAVMVQATRVIE